MSLLATQPGYWAFVVVAFAGMLWQFRRGSNRTYIAASAITMFALRWPTIVVVDPFIDESQMIAQAITAARYPIPWKDFDGTTSGPLNTYALLLPRLFGFSISWRQSRVVAALLVLVIVIAFNDSLRRLYGNTIARGATIVLVVLYGAASSTDLVQYASELLSIALLAIALNCTVSLAMVREQASRISFIGGLCCGSVPFAKLQATPLAAMLAGSLAVVIVVNRARNESIKRSLAALAGGVLAVAAVILPVVAVSGAFRDFFTSYIAQAVASLQGPRLGLDAALSVPEFKMFFATTAISIVVLGVLFFALVLRGMIARGVPSDLPRRAALPFSFVFLMVAFYAIQTPHRPYAHYMLLMLMPFLLVLVSLIGTLRQQYPQSSTILISLLAAYVIAISGQLLGHAYSTRDSSFLSRVRNGTGIARDAVASKIAEIAPPGARVAIWGYAPYLYVSSQMVMGTRDSISQFAILPGPYRDYYRRRFLDDLMRNRPALFVDAIAPGQFGLTDRGADGFEQFPELAQHIRTSYVLVDEVRGVRIFSRKD